MLNTSPAALPALNGGGSTPEEEDALDTLIPGEDTSNNTITPLVSCTTSELEVENLLRFSTPVSENKTSLSNFDGTLVNPAGPPVGPPYPEQNLCSEEERDLATILSEARLDKVQIFKNAHLHRHDLITERNALSLTISNQSGTVTTSASETPLFYCYHQPTLASVSVSEHSVPTPILLSPPPALELEQELARIKIHNTHLRKELTTARALNAKLVNQNFQLISKLKDTISLVEDLEARAQRAAKARSKTKEVIESGLEKLSSLRATCKSRPASRVLLPSYISKLAIFGGAPHGETRFSECKNADEETITQKYNKGLKPRRPRSLLPQRISNIKSRPRPSSCHLAFPSSSGRPESSYNDDLMILQHSDPIVTGTPFRRTVSETTIPTEDNAVYSRSLTSLTTPVSAEEDLNSVMEAGSGDSWSCFSVELQPVASNVVPNLSNTSVSSLALRSGPAPESEDTECDNSSSFPPASLSSVSVSDPSPEVITRALVEFVFTAQKQDPILLRMNKFGTSPASPDSDSTRERSNTKRLTASPDLRTTPREQLRDLFSTILSRASGPRIRPLSMSAVLEGKIESIHGAGLGLGTVLERTSTDSIEADAEIDTSPCPPMKQTKFSSKVDGLPRAGSLVSNLNVRPLSFSG